jgi:hypothetical protein
MLRRTRQAIGTAGWRGGLLLAVLLAAAFYLGTLTNIQ